MLGHNLNSLVWHRDNGQNSSDNNVMLLKLHNINTIIAGNVAGTHKGDEGMHPTEMIPMLNMAMLLLQSVFHTVSNPLQRVCWSPCCSV